MLGTALCRQRIVSGMITGGVGQAVASPTDVVKVRLQADGRLKAVGKVPRYQVRDTPSGEASQLGACGTGQQLARCRVVRRRSVDGSIP